MYFHRFDLPLYKVTETVKPALPFLNHMPDRKKLRNGEFSLLRWFNYSQEAKWGDIEDIPIERVSHTKVLGVTL